MTSVALSPNGNYIFCGGIDNSIAAINMKMNKAEYILYGHQETITGLSISNEGNKLLSNSMDNTLMMWNINPFVSSESEQYTRLLNTFYGHSHNFEKNLIRCSWSPDDKLVTSGSADRLVYVWDAQTTEIVHRLGGHKGQVNDVKIIKDAAENSKDMKIVSASSDKTLFIGAL